VVAEHGEDRRLGLGRRGDDDLGLGDRAVAGQVTGQEREVEVVVERREGRDHLFAVALAAVDVAGGGDADRPRLRMRFGPRHRSIHTRVWRFATRCQPKSHTTSTL